MTPRVQWLIVQVVWVLAFVGAVGAAAWGVGIVAGVWS